MERELRSDLLTAAGPPVPAAVGWKMVGAGLAAAALAVALGQAPGGETETWAVVARVLLALAAMVMAALAVRWRWRESPWYAAAAVVALAARFGLPYSWDSARLVATVLGGLSVFGLVLVSLPPVPRKILVSAFVLFHFGGILSAVTSPPATPYWTGQIWTRVYRPYLQFLYLNNAYHFYSPEPGPASLLWFCVKYDDGTPDHWARIPRRPEDVKDPLAVEYYRRLSLTEQINHLMPPNTPLPPGAADARTDVAIRGDPARKLPPIPFFPLNQIPPALQRRAPQDIVRDFTIPAYVRFVARHVPSGEHVRAVKMYRVEHQILSPADFARGASPYDPTLYVPYYLGEYDADGTLKDPDDPLLFWIIPILREPKRGVGDLSGSAVWDTDNYDYKDYVTIHAGSDHGEFTKHGGS